MHAYKAEGQAEMEKETEAERLHFFSLFFPMRNIDMCASALWLSFSPYIFFKSFFDFCLRLRVIARCGIIHTTSWQKAERAYDEFAKELVDDNGERPPLNHPSLYDQENVDKTCGSSSSSIIGSNIASSLLSSSASSAAAQGTSTELLRNSSNGNIKGTSKYNGISFDRSKNTFRCEIRLKSLGKRYKKQFKVDEHGEEGAEMLAGKFQ